MPTIRCLGHTFESIQAVLFDKDGTLANVESYLRSLGFARSRLTADCALEVRSPDLQPRLLSTFGLSTTQLDPAGLLAVGSRYENEIAAAACLASLGIGWIRSVALAKAAFGQAEASLAPKVRQTPMLPGVPQLLARLSAAGLTIGIVSSDLHTEVAAFVDHYKLADVDWYCGAAPATLPKTHPDFLRFACQSLAVSPQAVLVIGDSAADYALSQQGAAGFLSMTGGWNHSPEIAPEITTFSELTQVEVFN